MRRLLCIFVVAAAALIASTSALSAGPEAGASRARHENLAGQATVSFRAGMVVTESIRIEPGLYEIVASESLDEALIVVRGDGIELDMSGVRLRGIAPEAEPDQARGVAIRIDGGSDVTLRGADLSGYRFALLARGTRNLRLIDNELSYNWKPRLFSLIGHESLVDWLSFHDNEDREWMRFGAAVYLEDVQGGEIRGNRAVQGMNGLLLTRSTGLTIRDNELAFNSGLGVGMYRSSDNIVVRNRLDYNVRGYSHDFYQRGQDSAGILLYEQSNNNVIAYNSATHSGDGLFLWAGQSTMDTGQGGANDNLVYGNNFSFAPANAVEVTFSRNTIVANHLTGSRYGVWGGYSWETLIAGNCISGNEFGVAIEHGQDNVIDRNHFAVNGTAVELWANPSEPADWGYPQHRDTRSRDNRVIGNVFAANGRLWRLDDTSGLQIDGNDLLDSVPPDPCAAGSLLGAELSAFAPELPGVAAEVPEVARAGLDRSAMVVDEWGPYDGRSPKLWPLDTGREAVRLRVLGPAGAWSVRGRRGVAGLSASSGRTGEVLVVTPEPGAIGDWVLELEYVGAETTSPRGVEHPAGARVPFWFERFEPASAWDVRFFAWSDPAQDPGRPSVADATVDARDRAANTAAWESVLAGTPILIRTEPRLDYQWYRPSIAELPQERWALEATTTVTLPPGEYSVRTISDDGARVWVDDELVIDNWDEPHGSMVDYAALSGGQHRLRVDYYQLGGWAELRVEIVKGSARSRGSAGQ